METQDAALFRIAVAIEECVRKQKRRDILRGDIAGGYRLLTDGKQRIVEGTSVNQYESAAGAIAVQGEAVSARNEHHRPARFDRRKEKRVPVVRSRTASE